MTATKSLAERVLGLFSLADFSRGLSKPSTAVTLKEV